MDPRGGALLAVTLQELHQEDAGQRLVDDLRSGTARSQGVQQHRARTAQLLIERLRHIADLPIGEEHPEFAFGEAAKPGRIDSDDDHTARGVPAPAVLHTRWRQHDLVQPVGEIPMLAASPVLHAVRMRLKVEQEVVLLETSVGHSRRLRFEELQVQKLGSGRAHHVEAAKQSVRRIDVLIAH